jgi:hypothetical protein
MVDFKIPNICGASPELNDVLSKLADAKADAKAKLDEAASTAAAAFGEAQNELAGLKDKLQSIEIPTLPKLNLQAEIAGLASQIPGTPSFLSALAKIKTEFEDDIKSAGLELDSLVSDATKAILGGGDICALVPNLVKDSGSTEPAVQKPIAPKQAAAPAVTEAASVSNDNATVTAAVADNKQKTEAYAVTNKAPTEDSGAITVVKADKTIKSPAGGDVNVAPVGSGKTFSPDGGIPNRRASVLEKIKLSQITNLGKDGSFGELFSLKVTLKNQPIDKIIISLYLGDNMKNLLVVPEEGSTNQKIIGTHYNSYFGQHMYAWINTAANSTGSQNVKVDGKELIFSMPGSLLEDHPGNIVSVDNEILNVKGTFRCWGPFPASVRKDSVFGPGRFLEDKSLNKAFGGFAALIEYEYLDNYDPEPQT